MKKLMLLSLLSLLAVPAFAEEVKKEEVASKPQAETKEASVARGQFTTEVKNREPTDKLEKIALTSGVQNLYYFSEILNAQGKKAYHVWKKGDTELYKHPFDVNGPRWRVNSSIKAAQVTAGDKVTVETLVEDKLVDTKEVSVE